jgi:hypothetical protein
MRSTPEVSGMIVIILQKNQQLANLYISRLALGPALEALDIASPVAGQRAPARLSHYVALRSRAKRSIGLRAIPDTGETVAGSKRSDPESRETVRSRPCLPMVALVLSYTTVNTRCGPGANSRLVEASVYVIE